MIIVMIIVWYYLKKLEIVNVEEILYVFINVKVIYLNILY